MDETTTVQGRETFVERDYFGGICYQAANWIYVGQTKGRSRNDRYATLKVPVKDIYLYPFDKKISGGPQSAGGQAERATGRD